MVFSKDTYYFSKFTITSVLLHCTKTQDFGSSSDIEEHLLKTMNLFQPLEASPGFLADLLMNMAMWNKSCGGRRVSVTAQHNTTGQKRLRDVTRYRTVQVAPMELSYTKRSASSHSMIVVLGYRQMTLLRPNKDAFEHLSTDDGPTVITAMEWIYQGFWPLVLDLTTLLLRV